MPMVSIVCLSPSKSSLSFDMLLPAVAFLLFYWTIRGQGAAAAEAALALSIDAVLPSGLVDYFLVVRSFFWQLALQDGYWIMFGCLI